MKNSKIEKIIIKKSNEKAKAEPMDFPDYDEDNPIDNLPDALAILLSEEVDVDSEFLYSFFKNKLKT